MVTLVAPPTPPSSLRLAWGLVWRVTLWCAVLVGVASGTRAVTDIGLETATGLFYASSPPLPVLLVGGFVFRGAYGVLVGLVAGALAGVVVAAAALVLWFRAGRPADRALGVLPLLAAVLLASPVVAGSEFMFDQHARLGLTVWMQAMLLVALPARLALQQSGWQVMFAPTLKPRWWMAVVVALTCGVVLGSDHTLWYVFTSGLPRR